MMTLEDCHRSNSQQDRARKLRREMTLPERSLLPRQESFASLHILTRRASEGSEALPSLARRVSMSFFGARVIWYALRDRRLAAWKFRRQSPIGPYIVNFFCHAAGLVLEVDGRSHDDRYEADRTRQAELEARGSRVLRVSTDDILYHMEDVLNAILGALAGDGEPPHPAFGHPPLQGEGRGEGPD